MDNAKIGFVSGSVIAIAVLFIIVLYFAIKTEKRKTRLKKVENKKDMFKGEFFYIHNHTQKQISVGVEGPSLKKVEICSIPKFSSYGLNEKTAIDIFSTRENNTISVRFKSNFSENEHRHLLGNLRLKTTPDTMIKALHLGMVTSKTVGSRLGEDIVPGANAVQGRGNIYIHNLTPNVLRLNYNIVIPPNNTLKYYGRHSLGVALGTVFVDQDDVFKDFIYTIPATDIIYGINSDVEFPSYSGFCLDERGLTDIPHEPNYLLEEGFMGGPAFANIDPLFIPTEGEAPLFPVDRWGRDLSASALKKSNYLDNRKPFMEEGNLHVVA